MCRAGACESHYFASKYFSLRDLDKTSFTRGASSFSFGCQVVFSSLWAAEVLRQGPDTLPGDVRYQTQQSGILIFGKWSGSFDIFLFLFWTFLHLCASLVNSPRGVVCPFVLRHFHFAILRKTLLIMMAVIMTTMAARTMMMKMIKMIIRSN